MSYEKLNLPSILKQLNDVGITECRLEKLKQQYLKQKEKKRQEIMEDLQFQIDLLGDAERMDLKSRLFRDRSFLDWSPQHSVELQKLRDLKEYLSNNKDTWSLEHYFEVINSIEEE